MRCDNRKQEEQKFLNICKTQAVRKLILFKVQPPNWKTNPTTKTRPTVTKPESKRRTKLQRRRTKRGMTR